MFRIDRTHVNLSAARYIQIESFDITAAEEAAEEVGAEGEMPDTDQAPSEPVQTAQEALDAAASAAAMAKAKEIIEKAEAAAKDAADDIRDGARKEAESILREARENAIEESNAARKSAVEEGFAEGKADGQSKGYDEGFAQGEQEGRKDFDEKIREDDEKLLSTLNSVDESFMRAEEELEKGAAGLALGIVRKILDPSDAESGIFMSMIRNAVRQIRTDKKIVIRVGPDECKRFFPTGSAEFRLDSGVAVQATVLEDQTLGEGDAVIDAGEETVNAGLETQLRKIEIAFERADV